MIILPHFAVCVKAAVIGIPHKIYAKISTSKAAASWQPPSILQDYRAAISATIF